MVPFAILHAFDFRIVHGVWMVIPLIALGHDFGTNWEIRGITANALLANETREVNIIRFQFPARFYKVETEAYLNAETRA